ncbi:cadmium-translocating P-type ATPase [Candidatus Parcubacteria bacterium]|nr:MAG: cadmium-translocating P-type ATPase [Candidatus Parcubacteria bacterium]
MHPNIQREKSGLCPECGMNLVQAPGTRHQEPGRFDKHAGHSTNIFKAKFWVSLILSIPIVAYSDIAQSLVGYEAPIFSGSLYMPFVLASIIFFYGGWVFVASAYRELRARLPGMMTLIALAISVAYFYSVAVVFLGNGETLFWELATLITIMLLGHWMEMRAVSGAQGALKELSNLIPDEAEVLRNGTTATVLLSDLKKGDLAFVRPGARVPADGIIKQGNSDINESIVTGESKPVNKKIGDGVIAGATNGDGSLTIEITKVGEETFLAGVMRLVAEAQSSKSRLQMFSDRAAFYLTIIAVSTGAITLAIWLALADAPFAINRMVAVLVIACPHALGLAIPLVASISTTKAAKNGFLVKQRLALEAARRVDVVLFDKTGTLTEGKFKVVKSSSDEVLILAASVNFHSEHPIAKAMVEEAKKKRLPLQEATGFKRVPGLGAEALIGGKRTFVGTKGGDNIVVESNGEIIGTIDVVDAIRPESKEGIKKLKEAGVKVLMITGDGESTAKKVAQELGLDEYFARVLPEDKVHKVRDLQNRGLKVAMVGDGVNDAPALTQADLGIAIGAGTNVAIESAGIILVKDDPRDIPKIIKLSRMTYTKMIQNLFWATGYNIVAIPLAAGVLAFKGIFLQPALAAVFMSLSTVIVAVNALLLKNKRL